jgi:hypothetical protein
MNAVAYTDRAERVLALCQDRNPAAKVQVRWVYPARVKRATPSLVVYRSTKRAIPKTMVIFTDIQRNIPSNWKRPIHLPSANPWVEKVWSFARLSQGWNGSRAPAPTLRAIANAARFVYGMSAAGYHPTRVAPSAVGGVGITRRGGDRKVLIEFFNDGSASALFADDATEQMHIHRAKITPRGFRDVLERIREYLDG